MEFLFLPISITKKVRVLVRNCDTKNIKLQWNNFNLTVGVQIVISSEYLCLPFLFEWLSIVENRTWMKHSRNTDVGHVSIFAPVIRLIRKRAIYSEEPLVDPPSLCESTVESNLFVRNVYFVPLKPITESEQSSS